MFQKVNQIGMFAFMGIGLILMIMTMTMDIVVAEDGSCDNCGIVGGFIGMSYVLLGIAMVAALAGSVMTAVSDPKKMTGAGIGIGAMIVVFILSFLISSDEVLEAYGDITATTSQMVGAGLITFYILLILAVLSIIYASVSRMLK